MELESRTIENPIIHIPVDNVTSYDEAMDVLQQYQNMVKIGMVKAIHSFRWESPNLHIAIESRHPVTHV